MKYLLTIFIIINFNIIAQDIKPLFQTPYLDNQVAFEELADGSFVSLEIVMSVDTLLEIQNDYAYTTLKKYNAQGIETANYSFKYNDSTKYFGSFLTILDNGDFAVGGRKENSGNLDSENFLKIISQDLSQEELDLSISVFNIPNSLYLIDCFLKNNKIICLFSSLNENTKLIVRYDLQGNYIDDKPIYTNFSNPIGNWYVSSFYFNNAIFLPFAQTNLFVAPDTSFLMKVDLNDNIELINIQNNTNINSTLIHMDKKGCLKNNNEYLIGSRVMREDTISSYLTVLQINQNDSINIFYIDSSIVLNTENVHLNTYLSSKNKNNIFLVTDNYAAVTDQYLIYNLDNSGNLKWRKNISVNYGNYTYNYFYSLSTICATKDGGLIITFQADDIYNNHGVYYYKIDSLGNPVDFPTGIFSFGPKVEVNDFLLYPNPVQNVLQIETALQGKFKLSIHDVLGKEVSTFSFENNMVLNLEKLLKGNYFYTITNNDGKQIQAGKFLKE